jgi:hypothetical protein
VITRDASIFAPVFHGHAIAKHAMKRAVVPDERGRIVSQHLAQRFFTRVARDRGVQPRDGVAQSADKHDI